MKKNVIKNIVRIALFAAIATIIDQLLSFAVPFFPDFLKFKFPDVIGLLAGFMFGPWVGTAVQSIRVVLNILFNGTKTFYVGELSDFLLGVSFVLVSASIYKHKKTFVGALIALGVGGLVHVAFACFLNLFFLIPVYAYAFGGLDKVILSAAKAMPAIDSLGKIILYAILPFNLLKDVIIIIITLAVYKTLHRFINFVERKVYQENEEEVETEE
ncbi:MAG: ECF transporter S component [Bacillales bacterium]|jgi:riboflavin transporter FmnP|nr:ECF transporter S component [Bacillales bacterium]